MLSPVHGLTAKAFLAEASENLAISPWGPTVLHSAFAFKLRTGALSPIETEMPV